MTASVLVVEDEGIVATHLQLSLEHLGYSVPEVAASGEDAIRLARSLRPSLVLMDICLDGELDGIEAAQAIRADPGLPVVFLTANSDESTLARAREVAPYGYLLKPFNQRELRSTIEVALHRHRLEEALQARERWLSTVLRSIGDGVVATDASGHVLFVNPVAERIFGRPARAGMPARDLIAAVGDDIEASAAPIVDERDRRLGTVQVFRDVGDRRRLASASRLAAIGKLASDIAHEVNNPLAWVTANLSFVSSFLSDHAAGTLSAGDVAEIQAALKDARSGADRVARLLRDIRVFARGDGETAPAQSALDLDQVVTEACRDLPVTLHLGAPPPVVGSEERLAEVVRHLAGRGATAVTTRTAADGRAVIEIAPGGGAGLGLTVCQGVVAAMGGTLEADGDVRILLPAFKDRCIRT